MPSLSAPSSGSRRFSLRHALASAALLAIAAAQAQTPADIASSTAAPTVAGAQTLPGMPATGRTRAEVIAELQCARASGELDAAMLRSYGLEMPRAPTAACTPGQGAAMASDAPVTKTR